MGSLNIRNMTAEHKARVVARYREAGSVYAVRREFGHDHSTVRKICAEAGVVVKGQRRHGPLSLDEKASICLRYAAGDTLDSIIRDGAATFYTIRSVLNGAGLFIRGRTTRRGHPLSVAEQSELARRYVDGESSVDLELSFDVCKRTVLSVLKKAGVSRRDAIKVRKVVHPFGNVFLDAEDRPNAAYWLGFLMADGCVSIDRSFAGNAPRIAVTLKGDDVGHLELFRQFTGIEMPIRVVEYVTKMGFPTSRATYAFSQEEIATTAMSYGIIPAKTLVARVDDRLAWNPHFWRGMVDGDGCLYETKAGRIRLDLCGTEYNTRAFAAFGQRITGRVGAPHYSKGTWTYSFFGENAAAVCRELYANDYDALVRKKAKALRFMAYRSGRSIRPRRP